MKKGNNGILFCPFCRLKDNKKVPMESSSSLLLSVFCPVCPAEKVVEKDKDGEPTGRVYIVEDGKKYFKDPNSVRKIPIEQCS